MDWFIGTIAIFPLLRAYSRQQYYYSIHHQKKFLQNSNQHVSNEQQIITKFQKEKQFYEICVSHHLPKNLFKLITHLIDKHPHIPSIVELLDSNGILQTAIPTITKNYLRLFQQLTITYLPIFRGKHSFFYQRELVRMADGGTIALDWVIPYQQYAKNSNITFHDLPKERIILFLPGILGDSQSEYIYHFIPLLLQHGYTVVVYITRGCDHLQLTSPSLFSGKIANDFYEITRYMKLHYQRISENNINNKTSQLASVEGSKYKLFAIGYSLGASSLLNYLTRMKDRTFLTAAVSVCPPWNVIKNSLYPTFHSVIGSSLIGIPLKLYFLRHYSTLRTLNSEIAEKISYWRFLQGITIKDYDEALYQIFWESTLRENYEREKELGITEATITEETFQPIVSTKTHLTVVDYYHDINSSDHVADIQIPTLVLSALDDPICPHNYIPTGKACDVFGEYVVVVKTNFGGHLGYFEHNSWTTTWSDGVAVDWFDSF